MTEEVQKAFKTTITYVGGHSQGGFLTYSVILNFPDLYRGAFPMAGDCWMQNEPNLWEDKPEVLKKQKEIAIAVIHGKADPVVAFSQGEHAYDCFRAMGWTKLRLFAPADLNHMFMLAPVDEAIEWLDAMNGRNEKKSLEPRREVGQGRRVGMGVAHRQGLEVRRARDSAEIGRGRRGEGRPRDDRRRSRASPRTGFRSGSSSGASTERPTPRNRWSQITSRSATNSAAPPPVSSTNRRFFSAPTNATTPSRCSKSCATKGRTPIRVTSPASGCRKKSEGHPRKWNNLRDHQIRRPSAARATTDSRSRSKSPDRRNEFGIESLESSGNRRDF